MQSAFACKRQLLGTYELVAVNEKGEARTSGTIQVRTIVETDKPEIVQPLVQNIDAEEGESVCRRVRLDERIQALKIYFRCILKHAAFRSTTPISKYTILFSRYICL